MLQRILSVVLLIFSFNGDAFGQTKIAGLVGISTSVNMGEIGPSPFFKNTITFGKKIKFENDFEFNPIDKYTKAGWFVVNRFDVMIFPFESGFLIDIGADYRYRDGGLWNKQMIKFGLGAGYESKRSDHYRFSGKFKLISINDDIVYYPFLDFIVRGDYKINRDWDLRIETKLSAFKYIQGDKSRIAGRSNTGLGLVYKLK